MKLHANPILSYSISHIVHHTHLITQTIEITQLTVNNQHYKTSITLNNKGVTPWDIKAISEVTSDIINEWIQQRPELIIIGTGSQHLFLAPHLMVMLSQHGIGVECMTTSSAARTYNVLLEEGRNVMGALIL